MAMRVKRVEIGFADAAGFHATGARPAAKRKKKASGRKPKAKAVGRKRNPRTVSYNSIFTTRKAAEDAIRKRHKLGIGAKLIVREVVRGHGPSRRRYPEYEVITTYRQDDAGELMIQKHNPIPIKWATAKVRKLGNDIQVMLFPKGKVAKRRAARRNPRAPIREGYYTRPRGSYHRTLAVASKSAKLYSKEYGIARVEDGVTGKTVASFRWGVKERR